MDSIKHLKEKLLAFSQRTLKRRRQSSGALCCIEFLSKEFLFAYITSENGQSELQLVETIPCDVNNPLPALLAFVKNNELEGVECSWLLTSDKYQLITLDELPVKPEEFQSAIRWQIKKLLSFPADTAYIDFFPVPVAQITNPKKMITVVAAQADYIQKISEQIIESGLNLTTIDIQELGLRNITALYEKHDDATTALVYLQEKNSDLIITRQKAFYFSRRLDWNFQNLANNFENPENINSYLQKLALEIQRSFDYFQSQWRLPPPARVLIVTLNPNVLDIAAYMSQRLRFKVENLHLSTVLASKFELTSAIESQYLPVIGGVLRNEIDYATTD
jgi:MSHA biogenesis protein MshI